MKGTNSLDKHATPSSNMSMHESGFGGATDPSPQPMADVDGKQQNFMMSASPDKQSSLRYSFGNDMGYQASPMGQTRQLHD